MTTAAAPIVEEAETTDPATTEGTTAEEAATEQGAQAEPEEPVEAIEVSQDFVEGVGEQSETAGAFLGSL